MKFGYQVPSLTPISHKTPFEIMKRERIDAREKAVEFLHFGSFLIVLSDSEVRFGKINMKRIGSVDFQSFLTILRHFQKFNFGWQPLFKVGGSALAKSRDRSRAARASCQPPWAELKSAVSCEQNRIAPKLIKSSSKDYEQIIFTGQMMSDDFKK